jgi:hypothetical protein
MLQTHRSLEAYCATLWWRWLAFSIFPCNGASVEWQWQGKTEILWEKPILVPLCPPQIPHGLTRDWTRVGRPATNRRSHGTVLVCQFRIQFPSVFSPSGIFFLHTHIFGTFVIQDQHQILTSVGFRSSEVLQWVIRLLIRDVSKEHATFVCKGWRSGTPQPLKIEVCSFEILGIGNPASQCNYAENLNYCLSQFPYVFNLLGKIIIIIVIQ